MNTYYRRLLSEAQAEVREYQSNEPEAGDYSADVFDSLVESLEIAKHLSSRESFESQIESIIRMRMDQAPFDAELMPSFDELTAAMKQEPE